MEAHALDKAVYPIHTTRGTTVEMTRAMALDLLDSLVPRGLNWLIYGLEERGIHLCDFERACRHLRLAHHVFDVPPEVAVAEQKARRARGAPPTTRRLPHLMTEADRELADAMLDVYEREVEETASYLRERGLIPQGGGRGHAPQVPPRPAPGAAAPQGLYTPPPRGGASMEEHAGAERGASMEEHAGAERGASMEEHVSAEHGASMEAHVSGERGAGMPAGASKGGGEDTYPIHTTRGTTVEMTRAMALDLLDSLVPRGLNWLIYGLEERGIHLCDFERACRHFRLAHHVFDVPPEVAVAEQKARRARGAPPTTRRLPHLMTEADRELADAMLDLYERRVERVAPYLRERGLIP